MPVCLQRQSEVQWSLPTELHDHPDVGAGGGLVLVDGQHIFQGQRLEIQPVAGVVIGGHGLGIAVDHDGFVVVFAQREGRVAAAVIELDSLPDAVRPAAQDDDFAPGCGRRFVLFRRSNRGRGCRCRTQPRRYPPS